MDQVFEVNFDGLVCPTHTFSGLSFGNVASLKHKDQVSNPKKAALQVLDKMYLLSRLGIKQGVLPPHERPHIPTLKNLGYSGTDAEILAKAAEPLLAACSSASAMWAANSVTMAPSSDSQDGKVHITPANLIGNFHRSLETAMTERLIRKIFEDKSLFVIHSPLHTCYPFLDDGSANHIRFCRNFQEKGFHLFIYGESALLQKEGGPKKFPARQTLEASEAVSRLHGLRPDLTLFVRQSPEAIDKGAFHNDVISTGHRDLFLYHEKAFADTESVIDKLKENIVKSLGWELRAIEIKERDLSLEEAVRIYLFNSQIVTKADGSTVVIAPEESRGVIEDLLPGKEIVFVDLKESMQNGGGPACLRSRFILSQKEINAIRPNIFLNETLYQNLKNWISRHYRDRLRPSDLADVDLLEECRQALDELSHLLQLGAVYDFQK